MGLLDSLGYGGGGLLDFLRNNALNQQNSFSGLPSDIAQYGQQPLISSAPMPPVMQSASNAAPSQANAQMPSIVPQQPQAPQQQGPDFGSRLMAGIQGFSNENPGGVLQHLVNGIGSFSAGRRVDPAGLAQQALNPKAQFDAFVAAGLTPPQAMIAVMNPKIAESLVAKIAPTYSAHNVGNTTGAFNPATGEFKPAYTEPKYEKLGPGDNLISVGVGGKTNQIASGGPERPDKGYQWVDPNDPSKGEVATPGGPGTHLPSETAGRVAMMETGAAGLPGARKVLMDGRGSSGTGITGIAASVAGMGDTGRANRTVRVAIEGALRAMTGAAAPEAEVKRYEDMFLPSPTDSRQTAAQKLNQLDDFISNAKRLVTQGRGPAAPAGRVSDPLGIR